MESSERSLMADILARVLDGSRRVGRRGRAVYRPLVDVYHTAEGLAVACDLPGVRHEDIDVTATGRHLVICGRRQRASDVESVDCWESPFGHFELELTLPEGLDVDGADGRYRDGRLVIHFPYKGGPIFEGSFQVVVGS